MGKIFAICFVLPYFDEGSLQIVSIIIHLFWKLDLVNLKMHSPFFLSFRVPNNFPTNQLLGWILFLVL